MMMAIMMIMMIPFQYIACTYRRYFYGLDDDDDDDDDCDCSSDSDSDVM